MHRTARFAIAAALLALGLLALWWSRQTPEANKPPGPGPAADHTSVQGANLKPAGTRAGTAGAEKLPFRLKPRLTPEQADILAGGRVGDYLRSHPQEDDLLTAWAAQDPAAASAWLEAVGEIGIDGTGYYFSHLAALAAGVLAHGGVAEMQELLKKHAQDPLLPPKYQDGGFATNPWYKLAREDTAPEALAYLQAHPEEAELAGAFVSGIEDTDRMLAALDYLQAKGVDGDPSYWQFRSRVEKDGALLADWAAGAHPDLLEGVLIAWEASRPEETRQWLEANAKRTELAPVLEKIRKQMDQPAGDGTGEEEPGE